MSSISVDEFKQQYEAVQSNPPEVGAVLRPYDSEAKAVLVAEYVDAKEPFIYGQAFVPCIVGQAVSGWVLRTKDDNVNRGYKCILLPKARDAFLRKFPSLPDKVEIKSLRVVRYSGTKKAILCEVHEWE